MQSCLQDMNDYMKLEQFLILTVQQQNVHCILLQKLVQNINNDVHVNLELLY